MGLAGYVGGAAVAAAVVAYAIHVERRLEGLSAELAQCSRPAPSGRPPAPPASHMEEFEESPRRGGRG